MLNVPRFIKKYRDNGDYDLVPNPEANLMNCEAMSRNPRRPHSSSLWRKLAVYGIPQSMVGRGGKRKIRYVGPSRYEITKLSKDKALELLRKWAEFKQDNFLKYASRRKAHDKHKWKLFKKFKDSKCLVCKIGRIENMHHIITLSNGGTNDPKNIIGICFECHKSIHPWMQE